MAVPDTSTFSLQDVIDEFEAHSTTTYTSLSQLATDIIEENSPDTPDPGITWWDEYPNSLYGFRGYSHEVVTATLSLSAYTLYPAPGGETFTINVTCSISSMIWHSSIKELIYPYVTLNPSESTLRTGNQSFTVEFDAYPTGETRSGTLTVVTDSTSPHQATTQTISWSQNSQQA